MLIVFFSFLQNVEVLKDPDAVKQLGNILKTNVRACKALGHPYVLQVRYKFSFFLILEIYHPCLSLYMCVYDMG